MDDEKLKANAYPPEIKALNKAIADAQGQFPPIPKDKTAKVQMKTGGTYSYGYADLSSILALVRPVLSKHGLALVQRLENPSGGGPSIRTELRHADGGVIAASFPLGEFATMQELGGRATYVRRYALCGMLGIAAEDDDDGASAGSLRASAASRSPAAAPLKPDTTVSETPFRAPVLKEGKYAEEDLSADQRKMIFSLKTKLTNAGLFDDAGFKKQILDDYGVDSVTGLSKDDASKLIKRLLKREEELV